MVSACLQRNCVQAVPSLVTSVWPSRHLKPDSRPVWRWVGDCRQLTGARDWQLKVHGEVLRYAFGVLKLDDVVSFTVLANARSGRLPRLRRTGPGSRAATRARLRYIAMAISRQRRLRKNSNAIGNNGGSIPSATAASE